MSSYPCLESPVSRNRRPAPASRLRTTVLTVLLAAASLRSERTRSQG
jgi:hypothetical protein